MDPWARFCNLLVDIRLYTVTILPILFLWVFHWEGRFGRLWESLKAKDVGQENWETLYGLFMCLVIFAFGIYMITH